MPAETDGNIVVNGAAPVQPTDDELERLLATVTAARRAGVPDAALAHAFVEYADGGAVPEGEPEPAPPFEPFPLGALPPTLRALAEEGSRALGVDPAAVALPALVCAAGAIGLSRAVRIREGWVEPCVVWGAVVLPSGARKSPALDLAAEPLRDLDAEARRVYAREKADYEIKAAVHKKALKKWEREKTNVTEPPVLEAEEPTCTRVVASDVTVEALGHVLAASRRRSVTIVRDELAGWLASRGEYKKDGSGDSAKWIELYGGRPLSVDRVQAGSSLYVGRAAVSVVGTVQPGILRRALGYADFESGIAARLALAMPPTTARTWTDAVVRDATRAAYSEVIRALHAIEPNVHTFDDGEAEFVPKIIPLSAPAQERFARWVCDLGASSPTDGPLAAASAKAEGLAARLALDVELAGAARPADVAEVGVEAVEAGIAIAAWAYGEAGRVYAALGVGATPEDSAARERREALVWLTRRGPDGATPWDLAAEGPRLYRGKPDAARKVLDALAAAEVASMAVGPRGARTYRARAVAVDGANARHGPQSGVGPSTSTASTLPPPAEPEAADAGRPEANARDPVPDDGEDPEIPAGWEEVIL
jgi:hypothetical protein